MNWSHCEKLNRPIPFYLRNMAQPNPFSLPLGQRLHRNIGIPRAFCMFLGLASLKLLTSGLWNDTDWGRFPSPSLSLLSSQTLEATCWHGCATQWRDCGSWSLCVEAALGALIRSCMRQKKSCFCKPLGYTAYLSMAYLIMSQRTEQIFLVYKKNVK